MVAALAPQRRHGRGLGVWLSHTFDYDEPPTFEELADAHPLIHTAEHLRARLALAQASGHVITKDSPEGTVYLPGPRLR